MHFIYKIIHFIDVFFGGLNKTIYFRSVKQNKNRNNNPISPNKMSKIKKRIPEKPNPNYKNKRKTSFKRLFVLFVEKFGCINNVVYRFATE